MLIIITICIMALSVNSHSSFAQSQSIPDWIKNVATWWGQDQIADEEFFNLIEFLIDRNLIITPNSQSDMRIQELEDDLAKIKLKTMSYVKNAYNDGYENGLSVSNEKASNNNNYQSCDNAIKDEVSVVSLEYFRTFLYDDLYYMDENNLDNDFRYWDDVITKQLDNHVNNLKKYTANCDEAEFQGELNTMALIAWYSDVEYNIYQACDLIWENERQYSNECVRLLQPFDTLYALDEDNVRTDYESGYYDGFDEGSNFKTIIQNTEISWSFYDTKGNYYSWVMPVNTYEDLLRDSDKLSKYNTNVKPKSLVNDYGEKFTIVSLDGFTYKGAFDNIIDDLYENSDNNVDFIWEVWTLVSQLTVYDKDVDEFSEGRYALETLTRTGGDCEDLAILIGNMLYSSSYTKDWTIQYVYMDSDNPNNPKEPNHVIIYVDDGTYNYYIEATAEPSWDYYSNGVNGWFYDLV